ncbi:hypothetical protein Val02_37210 [Virgisporangium aliadipatigenens]|uniref:Glycosyltransferase RgtA/B/C/D-like domain-containing protein n=1 Tax=Virgisporangium aliadipatigenens TaxID=741659 RepID=A0A8J3YMW3_9ACTN|nr:hypothetical protein [Virgisporangium aliadipatigenens]GIJ46835.1 hypothetical protein Val02_37210 [Virgisporangium aliadipatigenens]
MAALVALPVVAFALTALAVRPRRPVPGPTRLALVRAALLVGGTAVVAVEALSHWTRLTFGGVLAVWLGGCVVAAAGAVARGRPSLPPFRGRLSGLGRAERVGVVALAGLVSVELLLALLSAPNTYDSLSYHLPRIEHWVAQHSVEPYAIAIARQVAYPPGAEYLLVHLRVLTGGDRFYAGVAWGAGVLCLLAVSRVAAQLGGGRRAQLIAAFVAGTAPTVVLEASSTQTDIIVALWVVAAATLVLDGISGPTRVVFVAVAAGLAGVTKSQTLVLVGVLVAWWLVAWLRRGWPSGRVRTSAGVAAAGLAVALVTAAFTGPFMWRNYVEFGNPTGHEYVRQSLTLQRHDPAALVCNGLRQAHSMFDTPVLPLGVAAGRAVGGMCRAMGVDPSDPAITFDNQTFPAVTWYPSEGKSAQPLQALLVVAGTVALLLRPGGGPGVAAVRRGTAALAVFGALVHVATMKWQPWGNRLTMYLLILAVPLAGLWLERLFARHPAPPASDDAAAGVGESRGRRALAGVAAVVIALGGVAGWGSAVYGWPRRLVGAESVFVLDRWHSLFVVREDWADDYRLVGQAVRDSGARRIGIVQNNDAYEYPWWLVLDGRELVSMQSQLPKRPPADPSTVDAVVCASTAEVCGWYAPNGWPVRQQGSLFYVIRP